MYKCIENIENEFILQLKWCKDPDTFVRIFNGGDIPENSDDDPDVLQMVASYAYLKQNDFQKAIELLKRSIAKGNVNAHSTLGNVHVRTRNYDLALQTLQRGHELGCKDCTFSLGQFYQVAVPDEERMNTYYSQVPERSQYNLGVYHFCRNDFKRALEHLEQAEANRDTMSYFLLWLCYTDMALCRKYKFLAAVCTPKRLYDLGKFDAIEKFVHAPIDLVGRFDEIMSAAELIEANEFLDLNLLQDDLQELVRIVF
jgi:tetratricopeptide (TPR) repeat protein